MVIVLLIFHGLVAVALLGAITHQLVSLLRQRARASGSFVDRYTTVNQGIFTCAVALLYCVGVVLGAVIYPSYRLNVRIPFEEMTLGWAIGLFELKEHFAGIGLSVLPVYILAWKADAAEPRQQRHRRIALTSLLAFIVWWDFLIGHVLNNLRGLA